MPRLAWATDIHLNFIGPSEIDAFADALVAERCDGYVLSGDISEGPEVVTHLERLAGRLDGPLFFVLGNHDYYRSTIAEVRAQVGALSDRDERLCYLPHRGATSLGDDVWIVGCDGWGDARLGDPVGTPIRLNDFVYIGELFGLGYPQLCKKLRALGDEEAQRLAGALHEVADGARHVLVVTHVPPFEQSCWHEGEISDANWLPFFTCDAVGRLLENVAASHPEVTFTVLCGHTHGKGTAQVRDNLVIHTGGADYGHPRLARVVVLPNA